MTNMRSASKHSISLFVGGGLALFFLFTALTLGFDDSEIWGITGSQRIFSAHESWNSSWFKPAFSLLFGALIELSRACDWSDWTVLSLARLIAWTAALGTLALTAIGLPKPNRYGMLILYATCPVVVLNLCKVRSDGFSALAALMAVSFMRRCGPSLRRQIVVFVFGASVTLLFTPKALDLYAIQALTFLSLNRDEKISPLPRPAMVLAAIALAPLALVLLPILVFAPGTLAALAQYGLSTYQSSAARDPDTWIYVFDLLFSSPVLSAAIVFGIGSGFLHYRQLGPTDRALHWGGAVALAAVLIAPQKLPFFIASRLPFLTLGSAVGLARLSIGPRWRAALILTGAALSAGRFSTTPFRHFDRAEQGLAYEKIDALIRDAAPTDYWDAIGLFPLRNSIFHYPSPGDRSNDDIAEVIQDRKPKLILKTSKVSLLGPLFTEWLRVNYVETAPNVWIRRISLASSTGCIWSARDILEQARAEGLAAPLAIAVRPDAHGAAETPWNRVPFHFANGVEVDSLTEPVPWMIQYSPCNTSGTSEFAVTEESPWRHFDLPDFSALFGFVGRL